MKIFYRLIGCDWKLAFNGLGNEVGRVFGGRRDFMRKRFPTRRPRLFFLIFSFLCYLVGFMVCACAIFFF